ncbi:MAG: GC-type dockerin domain-anchored protein, partial [Phycisphaerales bacterium]
VSALLARYTLTGIPTIARQPTAAAPIISAGQTIEVTFTPSPGYSVQNVRWSRDGVPIFNGPGGASPDGGTVIGGATDIITPTDGSPVSLLITGAQPSDSGRYAVTLVSACGQATSQDVAVRVNPAACSPADIATTDGQTGFADGGPDGAIDNGDFVAFFAAFFAGDGDPSRAAADIANADGATTLDGGGPDGAVTSTDFAAFFALFFEGCGG